MNQFISIHELNFVNGEHDTYTDVSKILDMADNLTRYYLSVGIDVNIVELFNFAQNYMSGNHNSRILASIFDIACSRISDLDILYNCYKKTVSLNTHINIWNKWTDDFHKMFLYTLCNNNCINGFDVIIKIFPLNSKKNITSSLFMCVCKYGTKNAIPILERLLIELTSEVLQKDLGYIVNTSISNEKDDPSILQWVFEKWPESKDILDSSHISSAGFPGNMKCIQLAFSVNSNIDILDNILLGLCYNNNIPLLKLILDYNPKLDITYMESICFLKYAKKAYTENNDLSLAHYLMKLRPYKFMLNQKKDTFVFDIRTDEEENRLKTRYHVLAISKQKNKKNLLWNISDDVNRYIIQYV